MLDDRIRISKIAKDTSTRRAWNQDSNISLFKNEIIEDKFIVASRGSSQLGRSSCLALNVKH